MSDRAAKIWERIIAGVKISEDEFDPWFEGEPCWIWQGGDSGHAVVTE